MAASSVNVSGPNRSRKHQGPISRRPFTGSARWTTRDPSVTSRDGCASNGCRDAPSATHASAATVESAMLHLRSGMLAEIGFHHRAHGDDLWSPAACARSMAAFASTSPTWRPRIAGDRLGGGDHRMPGRTGVFRRVPVGRVVAARSRTARLARPEVHPRRTDFHALPTFTEGSAIDVAHHPHRPRADGAPLRREPSLSRRGMLGESSVSSGRHRDRSCRWSPAGGCARQPRAPSRWCYRSSRGRHPPQSL